MILYKQKDGKKGWSKPGVKTETTGIDGYQGKKAPEKEMGKRSLADCSL